MFAGVSGWCGMAKLLALMPWNRARGLMGLIDLLSVLARAALVGFALGLLGGGGSILAVPLLVYVVGVKDPHVAIGTSALAVSVNAFANLIAHARAGTVKWPCAIVFAVCRHRGRGAGRHSGPAGRRPASAVSVRAGDAGGRRRHVQSARGRRRSAGAHRSRDRRCGWSVHGLVVGFLSGFFGIGGGFLIVPAIMLGSGMAAINAVGSSLVSVGAFGLTTAATYAMAGLVDWRIAALLRRWAECGRACGRASFRPPVGAARACFRADSP